MKQGKPTKEEMVLAAVRASNKDQRELVEKYKQPKPNKAHEKVEECAINVWKLHNGEFNPPLWFTDFVERIYGMGEQQAILSERKRLLEEVDKMRRNTEQKMGKYGAPHCVACDGLPNECCCDEFNDALDQVIKLINNK